MQSRCKSGPRCGPQGGPGESGGFADLAAIDDSKVRLRIWRFGGIKPKTDQDILEMISLNFFRLRSPSCFNESIGFFSSRR